MTLPANRHKWPFISHLTIWDFACLTFDIEPEHGDLYQSLPTEFIPVSWRRAQFEIRSDVLHLFPDKFKDRLEMLLAHFDTREGRFLYLSPLDGSSVYAHSSVLREVPRADADAFAKHCQWPVPKELEYRALPKPPKPEISITTSFTHSPLVKATESTLDRQDRRLKACEDAGFLMPKNSLGRLPDGVGKMAALDGVMRQTFSRDVRAALKRREAQKREGTIVRRA